jgi:hypothetical protein
VAKFCGEAIFSLNSEEGSASSKDDGFDEMNEAILLALPEEPFSSVQQIADSPQDKRSKKHYISLACRFFALRSQTSDNFIGLLINSLTVNSQMASRVELSCRSNFATSSCPSGIKDSMEMHMNP